MSSPRAYSREGVAARIGRRAGRRAVLKEIEVTANLQHPHILPLFDSGEADTFSATSRSRVQTLLILRCQ